MGHDKAKQGEGGIVKYYFKTEGLSVGYHKKPIIKDIEIGLEKGEILTLIGPNGAGKSTVLKSIAKQLAIIAGTIYLDEQSVESMSGTELSQNMAVVLTEKLRTEMMTCEDRAGKGLLLACLQYLVFQRCQTRIIAAGIVEDFKGMSVQGFQIETYLVLLLLLQIDTGCNRQFGFPNVCVVAG